MADRMGAGGASISIMLFILAVSCCLMTGVTQSIATLAALNRIHWQVYSDRSQATTASEQTKPWGRELALRLVRRHALRIGYPAPIHGARRLDINDGRALNCSPAAERLLQEQDRPRSLLMSA